MFKRNDILFKFFHLLVTNLIEIVIELYWKIFFITFFSSSFSKIIVYDDDNNNNTVVMITVNCFCYQYSKSEYWIGKSLIMTSFCCSPSFSFRFWCYSCYFSSLFSLSFFLFHFNYCWHRLSIRCNIMNIYLIREIDNDNDNDNDIIGQVQVGHLFLWFESDSRIVRFEVVEWKWLRYRGRKHVV